MLGMRCALINGRSVPFSNGVVELYDLVLYSFQHMQYFSVFKNVAALLKLMQF